MVTILILIVTKTKYMCIIRSKRGLTGQVCRAVGKGWEKSCIFMGIGDTEFKSRWLDLWSPGLSTGGDILFPRPIPVSRFYPTAGRQLRRRLALRAML